jgi:heptosyltransferase II
MPSIRSFLVINPFGIGDVLFSTPLLQNVKSAFPGSKIYYLCNRKTYPIVSNHPLITKAFVYERDDFVSAQKESWFGWFKKAADFIGEIRAEEIEACIDLSLNTQYGFVAWAAGIRTRVGLDYKKRGFFLNRKVTIAGFDDKHVAEYYLDCLKPFGVSVKPYPLSIGFDDVSNEWAKKFLREKNIERHHIIVGIAPCGGDAFGKDAALKRWPAAGFASLIRGLRKQLNATIFLFAGSRERQDIGDILKSVPSKVGVFEFTKTSLLQTVALIDKCDLFIGNDTGPMRFADALNKKIIALFGPVDEKVYGPYPDDKGRCIVLTKALPCRPCYRRFRISPCVNERKCLTDISVEEVMSAVKRLC